MNQKTLNDAVVGERLSILKLSCESGIRKRLRDLGMVEGTVVECVGVAPLGDPSAFLIRGAVIALRAFDTQNIIVEEVGG